MRKISKQPSTELARPERDSSEPVRKPGELVPIGKDFTRWQVAAAKLSNYLARFEDNPGSTSGTKPRQPRLSTNDFSFVGEPSLRSFRTIDTPSKVPSELPLDSATLLLPSSRYTAIPGVNPTDEQMIRKSDHYYSPYVSEYPQQFSDTDSEGNTFVISTTPSGLPLGPHRQADVDYAEPRLGLRTWSDLRSMITKYYSWNDDDFSDLPPRLQRQLVELPARFAAFSANTGRIASSGCCELPPAYMFDTQVDDVRSILGPPLITDESQTDRVVYLRLGFDLDNAIQHDKENPQLASPGGHRHNSPKSRNSATKSAAEILGLNLGSASNAHMAKVLFPGNDVYTRHERLPLLAERSRYIEFAVRGLSRYVAEPGAQTTQLIVDIFNVSDVERSMPVSAVDSWRDAGFCPGD